MILINTFPPCDIHSAIPDFGVGGGGGGGASFLHTARMGKCAKDMYIVKPCFLVIQACNATYSGKWTAIELNGASASSNFKHPYRMHSSCENHSEANLGSRCVTQANLLMVGN